MRDYWHRQVKEALDELWDTPAQKMLYLAKLLGEMAEAELFMEGELLAGISITPIEDVDEYFTEIVTVEELDEGE